MKKFRGLSITGNRKLKTGNYFDDESRSQSTNSCFAGNLKMKTYFMLCCAIALLFCGTVALSEAFKLPDTGLTKCYQTVSPYAEIPCAGTGQDGAYAINPMSYADNGNGTVTDKNTGLMWQKGENPSTYNWYQASGTYDVTYNSTSQDVCGSLVLGYYSDWRLPSKKELITIVDYSWLYPKPNINTIYFPNAYADIYWTSTPRVGADDAWIVYFDGGGEYER